jgi:hypothetical protein
VDLCFRPSVAAKLPPCEHAACAPALPAGSLLCACPCMPVHWHELCSKQLHSVPHSPPISTRCLPQSFSTAPG